MRVMHKSCSSHARDALRRRRRSRCHFFDLALPHHPLDFVFDRAPLLVFDQLLDREREHVARPALPTDPPINDRVGATLADIDETDCAALLFDLSDESVRRESRERGAGAEELRRFFDEMFRVTPCERLKRFAEEDDALWSKKRQSIVSCSHSEADCLVMRLEIMRGLTGFIGPPQ